MTKLKLFTALLTTLFLYPAMASAGRATPFNGWYEILSQSERAAPATKEYLLLDADTLGAIWARHADTPLPADLEQYRNEPSVFTAFTNRPLIFLMLERGMLIGNGYLVMQGANGEQLELNRRPDGRFDMFVKEGPRRTTYLLAPPRPQPEELKFR